MSDDDLVFYTHPMSRGRMARWMLEEVGRPYRTELLDYGTTMKQAAYLAINPVGKVPAIRHGAAVVTETGAICAYLADAFPGSGLAPPVGDPARASYLRWLFFGAGPIEAAITNQALDVAVPQERAGMLGYGSLAAVLATVEQAIDSHEYLTGDRFSAADLYVASLLGWGMAFGMVEKRGALVAYCARLTAREAAQRARAIDDALLMDHEPAGAA